MSAVPVQPDRSEVRARLEPFESSAAELVASWIRSPQDAFWLAPRTPPPLGADKVRNWNRPGREPLLLRDLDADRLVAYGELNELNAERGEFWLGHLLVDPDQRGRGFGQRLTALLLDRAFTLRGARRISLVVFQENLGAIAAYRRAGMHDDGFETHYFPPYARRMRLLRMAVTRLT